jgi:NAD(P)H dehydrogenase (quinone)
MGGPAWQFKKFADTSSKPWFSLAWNDKIAGGFTNSAALNGDKFPQSNISGRSPNSTAIWSALGGCPPTPRRMAPTTSTEQVGYAGALAISPPDASPEEAPRSGDLMTARLLGERIAEVAARVTKR